MDDILANATAVLSTTPNRWMQLVQTLPDKLFRRPAIEGQWSAFECLQHLTDVENTFFFRLTVFMENGSEFPAYDPDSPDNKLDTKAKPADLVEEFAHRREASLKALGLVTNAVLDRRARHADLGEVTMEQFLHEWAAHDLNHTIQAERALMQPFIHGSGPWIRYFADHIIPEA